MNKVYIGFCGIEIPELFMFLTDILNKEGINSMILDYSEHSGIRDIFSFVSGETVNGPVSYKNTVYMDVMSGGREEYNGVEAVIEEYKAEVILINYGRRDICMHKPDELILLTDERLHNVLFIEKHIAGASCKTSVIIENCIGYSGATGRLRDVIQKNGKKKDIHIYCIKFHEKDRKTALLSVYNESFSMERLSGRYKRCLDGIIGDIIHAGGKQK